MRALLVGAALVGVGVGVGGCQYGISRPGFEFRVFRPGIALEPHLVEGDQRRLGALPLQAPGARVFEPAPPELVGAPSVRTYAAPLPPGPVVSCPAPAVRTYAAPIPPGPVVFDSCTAGAMIGILQRIERRLAAPERVAPPRSNPCPEE